MHRTTIMLPEDLRQRAVRKAQEMGISLGEFMRNCAEKELKAEKKGKHKRKERDPFFADEEVWTGPAPRDGSINIDKYLYDDEDEA